MGSSITYCCCHCGCKYCCGSCCDQFRAPPEGTKTIDDLKEDCKAWKTGDLILERSPDTFNNNLVKATGNTPWTHSGLVWVDRSTGIVNLVEITAERNYHVAPLGEHYAKELLLWKSEQRYMAHRPLKQTLNDEQLDKFEEGMEALKNKPFDESIDIVGAGCDCCDCFTCCGDVYAWGNNRQKQCGVEANEDDISIPRRIKFFDDYIVDKIKVGQRHNYVHTECGKNYIWGDNENKECINFDNEDFIARPHQIDDIVKKQCSIRQIVDVQLVWYNTVLIGA